MIYRLFNAAHALQDRQAGFAPAFDIGPAVLERQPLTQRQLECLAWISEGKSSTDVAEILSISSRTVDYHVGEICQRLNVRTRMQAVAHAVRRGWLTC